MRALIIGALASVLHVGEASAVIEWLGGEGPPFIFVANAIGNMRPGDTLTVVVAIGGQYYGSPRVQARLTIPRELRLLYGDTLIDMPLDRAQGDWTLGLGPQSSGSYELRGQLKIDGVEGTDRGEFVMRVQVDPDTVIVERSRYTRLESLRKGRRYRYTDWWLVPVDSAEASVVETDLETIGQRARNMREQIARCTECERTALPDTVNFVVVIDRLGRVREARVLGSVRHGAKGYPPSVIKAARVALDQWPEPVNDFETPAS